MPRDPKRRSRRSLPSAVERTLSLHELLGDDDRSARRKKVQDKALAELQLLNSYFAMIDQTELQVEASSQSESSPVSSQESSAPPLDGEHDGTVSDSELVRPTARRAVRTQRTLRRRNLKDQRLQDEYRDYCDATADAGKPLSIAEFARTIEPEVKTGMYEGILDICTE